MEVNNKEVLMMNKIIISAIEYGGDSGGPYFSDRRTFEESLSMWLKVKGLDKDFKISKSNWSFIIPIDEEDIEFPNFSERNNEGYFNAFVKASDKESEWYQYFTERFYAYFSRRCFDEE